MAKAIIVELPAALDKEGVDQYIDETFEKSLRWANISLISLDVDSLTEAKKTVYEQIDIVNKSNNLRWIPDSAEIQVFLPPRDEDEENDEEQESQEYLEYLIEKGLKDFQAVIKTSSSLVAAAIISKKNSARFS